VTTPTDQPTVLKPSEGLPPVRRASRKRLALAFLIGVVSDVLSFAMMLAPLMQWVIDLGTALLLFLVIGRRWAILPGLISLRCSNDTRRGSGGPQSGCHLASLAALDPDRGTSISHPSHGG
jgi:hypothetical protein